MLSVVGLRWPPAYAKFFRHEFTTKPSYSFFLPNTNNSLKSSPHFHLKTYFKRTEQLTPFSQGFSALKEYSPLESGNLWSTLALYVFTLHVPFSFGGLSLVALLTRQSVLDPQTEVLSLLIIQTLELNAALVLFKYTAKPRYKFTNFFKNKNLLNDRNWFVASVVGFGVLVLLIFLTSLLADRLFGSKPVNPIVKEILLNSDISRLSCVLVYCIVTPLLEEVVYRGFLLTSLSTTMEWQQAVAISSIIFSAIHFSGENFLQLFIIGCVLGCSYCWTGNLKSSIAGFCSPLLMSMIFNKRTGEETNFRDGLGQKLLERIGYGLLSVLGTLAVYKRRVWRDIGFIEEEVYSEIVFTI